MALPARYEGAFAKFERAQVHIASLAESVRSYTDGQNWRPEKLEDQPDGMVRIRLLKLPPPDLGLILGDVVHNLRSALDYATCSLVEFGNEGADISKVQFPFGRAGHELNSRER